MPLTKLLSLFLSFCLILEQPVFAQAIDLSHYFVHNPAQAIQSDKFRPLHLRYISYDSQANDFKVLLDKGDFFNQKTEKPKNEKTLELEKNTQELMKYFFIGLSLPNDKFWVNLRPDSPDNILDPDLEKTDIGRIFLEADLQLKKDTASFTSPQNPEGKAYWDKLYKKAGELFGSENITIPTITRPWIVPNEIIIREAPDNAYIYKATLKVMLEEDYLDQKTEKPKNGKTEELKNQRTDWHSFSDPRLKELNEYSTELIRETIIPKLTYAVNTAKRYAPLRQVYYSLILAQWFKQKYGSLGSSRASGASAPVNSYIDLIDSGNLTWRTPTNNSSLITHNFSLITKHLYSKELYFQQYQKSFKDGEYNLQEPVYTPMGQSIRRYTSRGVEMIKVLPSEIIKGKDEPPDNKKYLSSPIIYGPDGMIIDGNLPLVVLPKPQKRPNSVILGPDGNPLRESPGVMAGDKTISPASSEETVKYGKGIISGISNTDLGQVKGWIATRGQIIGSVATVDAVIDKYLYAMGMERGEQVDYLEAIRKGITDIPVGVAKEAAKWLEYLLYPDKALGDFIAQLDAGWADMLFNCYRIKGSMTGRSIDLLIGYLEIDKNNAALRQKLKTMFSLAAPDLFDGGILERIKKLSLGNREDVLSFLPVEIKEEVKNMWEKDDERILQKIIPKCGQLSTLSAPEFIELLTAVRGTGSKVFYSPEEMIYLEGIVPLFNRTFGVENEVRIGKTVVESRFPKETEGFSNKPGDWKALQKSLKGSMIYDFDEMGIHCHISREGLGGASQQALSRIIVGWEAIFAVVWIFCLVEYP